MGRDRQFAEQYEAEMRQGRIANEPVSSDYFAKGGEFHQLMAQSVAFNSDDLEGFGTRFEKLMEVDPNILIKSNERRALKVLIAMREMDRYGTVIPASEMRDNDDIETLPNGMKAIGFRTVTEKHGTSADTYNDQLRAGTFYMGRGVFGSGVYVAMPPLNGELFEDRKSPGRPMTPLEAFTMAHYYADTFRHTGTTPQSMVAIGLRKGAKTNLDDLGDKGKPNDEWGTSAERSLERIRAEFKKRYGFEVQDPSLAAAALGYDAIVTIGNGLTSPAVFNRIQMNRALENAENPNVNIRRGYYEEGSTAIGSVLHIAFLNRRAMIIASENGTTPKEVV